MIFAEYTSPPPREWRDILAFWSDVLGVLGFFLALFGVGVALFIERKIRQAKAEAEAKIEGMARLQFERESYEVRRWLELARESCRTKDWLRAGIQFDGAVGVLIRLVSTADFSEDIRDAAQSGIDNLRMLVESVRGRKKKDGPLADDKLSILDDTIRSTIRMEAWLANQRGGTGR
jgi:hypothetical protein